MALQDYDTEWPGGPRRPYGPAGNPPAPTYGVTPGAMPTQGGPNPYAVSAPSMASWGSYAQPNFAQMRQYMGDPSKMDPNILSNLQNVSKMAYAGAEGFGVPSLRNYIQASDTYSNLISGNRGMSNAFLAPERMAIEEATQGAITAIQNQAGVPAAAKAMAIAEAQRQGAAQTGGLQMSLLKDSTAALGQLGVQGGQLAAEFSSQMQGANQAQAQYHLGIEGINQAKRELGAQMELANRSLGADLAKAGGQLQLGYDTLNVNSALDANRMAIDSYFKNLDFQLQNDQWNWQRNVYFPWTVSERNKERQAQEKAAKQAKWGGILGTGAQLATGFL